MKLADIEREDLIMFLNAARCGSGQAEYYASAGEQTDALSFLHDYVRINYPVVYRRCLAAGTNHFNQAAIVLGLLAQGAPDDPVARAEEGALVFRALEALPPHRVYRIFRTLRKNRVNNRRSRACVRRWLKGRDLAFDAVKYRQGLMSAAAHAHVKLPDEVRAFLFEGPDARRAWGHPLLDAFRRARYEERAIYELPYTVAEGLASQRGVPRARFLKGIEPRLTAAERRRLIKTRERHGVVVEADALMRMSLTRLCLFVLGLSFEEREQRREELEAALEVVAKRTARFTDLRLGRVVGVLDRSRSAEGSREKKNRALAVAMAAHYLLPHLSTHYRSIWTSPLADPLLLASRGQTRIAEPLLDALQGAPDLVVVVSDGFENDPPGGAAEIVRVFRERIDPKGKTRFVHLNPVFDDDTYAPRCLGPEVPAMGVRNGEDLISAIGLARFADGREDLVELERHLDRLARRFLKDTDSHEN